MHELWPDTQLLLQVREHPALGASPEHVVAPVQDIVEAT
jgi:hypothetical protein